jgi:AraC family transcriptional regulator
MDPVGKALWFVESNFAAAISLDAIAAASGVSRYHLCRAFGAATGQSVMRYVRARRLSEAARALAAGAPDILTVALDWGYGSHEAFTRAFRDQFGTTPERVRAGRDLATLSLVEPIKMTETRRDPLEPPRLVAGKSLLVAGLAARFSFETAAGIPALWQRFVPHIGHVPGQLGGVAYGVCFNADDGDGSFDYLAGVAVASFADLAENFARVRIPEQSYAVFVHRDHASNLQSTFQAIWRDWLPRSGRQASDGPSFERYDEAFDPRTGTGPVEVWVPLKG